MWMHFKFWWWIGNSGRHFAPWKDWYSDASFYIKSPPKRNCEKARQMNLNITRYVHILHRCFVFWPFKINSSIIWATNIVSIIKQYNIVLCSFGTLIGVIGVKYDKQDRLVSCLVIISNCRRIVLWKLRNFTLFVRYYAAWY